MCQPVTKQDLHIVFPGLYLQYANAQAQDAVHLDILGLAIMHSAIFSKSTWHNGD